MPVHEPAVQRMSASPSPPLPRRLPTNAAPDRRRKWEAEMREWLAWKMDQESIEALNHCTVGELAVAAARAGDPELLRELYPDHADCIYSPKLGRGEKRPKFPVQPTKSDLRKVAANYARRIRAIWRAEKIVQRLRPGEKSAEEYAIEILWKHFGEVAAGLDVDDVIAAGKTGGKRKRKAPVGQ
jgi:hypothetical protein